MTSSSACVFAIDCKDAHPGLKRLGLEVRGFSSLEAAKKKLKDARNVAAVVLSGKALKGEEVGPTVRAVRSLQARSAVFVWAPKSHSGVVRAALMNGATDVVLEKDPTALAEALESALDKDVVQSPLERLRKARNRGGRFQGMVSRSPRMWDIFETCVRVAPTDATVLILGETGTGKERLARAVHELSRRPGRWVAVNCGAVPDNLIESELFGHEKGAFTGASRAKTGLFRHAERGTLFLDEVGNLSMEAQFSLLRTLQENTIRPVGGQEEIPVDVRVIAATNVELENAVVDESFREDLLYRLDVIRLVIPPLRERPEDILHLFGHFARKLGKYHARALPEMKESFTESLISHPWPGNVRELENFTERLILTHRDQALTRKTFRQLTRSYSQRQSRPAVAGPAARPTPADPSRPVGLGKTPPLPGTDVVAVDISRPLEDLTLELERRYLRAALADHHGRIQETASSMGISRRTLLRRLRKHEIDKRDFY